ncbi:hypothetical protein H9Q10_03730 [Eikenella sp. S3360]|uniref:SMI1/KNR4 family protein n=1 Tax=Eikenella glucosivorans TaxID=2766967 RepID=A0ABS0N8Z1_9NEIS|nr:hypothetical protein [Eikenella glucosivorans]MBH5328777.1 hypothetical protein [Eikenella glucosivorans]
MTDFIRLLETCREPDTAIPYRHDRISGYNVAELAEIAERYNLNITGQLHDLLYQMGKCSGGLLLSHSCALYGGAAKPLFRQNWAEYDDEDRSIVHAAGVEPVGRQMLLIAADTAADYFLLTADGDNRIWCWQESRGLYPTDQDLASFLAAQAAAFNRTAGRVARLWPADDAEFRRKTLGALLQ